MGLAALRPTLRRFSATETKEHVSRTAASDQHRHAGLPGHAAAEHGPGQPHAAAADRAGRGAVDLVDRRAGLVPLEPRQASALALLVGGYFAVRWMRVDAEARILALADLVVYLQVILFFQKKDRSVYWMLAIISLLEVVVAAYFSQRACSA